MFLKLRLIYRILRISKDPNRTEDILKLGAIFRESADRRQKERFEKFLLSDSNFASLYTKLGKQRDGATYNISQLMKSPQNSLGYQYANMMTNKNLDPQFYGHFEVKDPFSLFGLRLRKTHDIWHVLTGFDTDVPGELGLQTFVLAQIEYPFTFAIILGGLLHLFRSQKWELLIPAMEQISKGFISGRRAKKIFGIYWEDFWSEDLGSIRQRYLIS